MAKIALELDKLTSFNLGEGYSGGWLGLFGQMLAF